MAIARAVASTKKLKMGKMMSLKKGQGVYARYGKHSDTFQFLIVPPDRETIVHYLDEHIALLYLPRTREVVGVQIEDFESYFIPTHAELEHVWKLSELDPACVDLGELFIKVEEIKPRITKEVVRFASQQAFGSQAHRFMSSLETAHVY